MVNDEECGYTVNRVDEWCWRGRLTGRFRLAVDMLKVQVNDKMETCDYVAIVRRLHCSWRTTTTRCWTTPFTKWTRTTTRRVI